MLITRYYYISYVDTQEPGIPIFKCSVCHAGVFACSVLFDFCQKDYFYLKTRKVYPEYVFCTKKTCKEKYMAKFLKTFSDKNV